MKPRQSPGNVHEVAPMSKPRRFRPRWPLQQEDRCQQVNIVLHSGNVFESISVVHAMKGMPSQYS
jgi:hypothetical protein